MRRAWCAFLVVLGLAGARPATGQPFGPSGGQFQVSTTIFADADNPEVGVDLLGRFFVVWSAPDGDGGGVHGRRYNQNGSPIDNAFRVNVVTTNDQTAPRIAVGRTGNFATAVTWHRTELFGRRFNSSGPVTDTFRVNNTTDHAYGSSVAMDSGGNWVSVWTNDNDLVGQRFDSSGSALGGEFTITSTFYLSEVDVARAPGGAFVALWQQTPNVL